MGSNTLSVEFVFVEGKNKRGCILFSGQRQTWQRISEGEEYSETKRWQSPGLAVLKQTLSRHRPWFSHVESGLESKIDQAWWSEWKVYPFRI